MQPKIILLKNWCTKNITPLAWQRIILKILPQLREKGFDLSELESPSEDRCFGEAEFDLFIQTLENMYGMVFPKEVLKKTS